MASTKTVPSLEHFEFCLDEAAEVYQEFQGLRQRLRGAKRGSEAYFHLMAKIAVCADVIKVKTASLVETIEAIEDAMPNDD